MYMLGVWRGFAVVNWNSRQLTGKIGEAMRVWRRVRGDADPRGRVRTKDGSGGLESRSSEVGGVGSLANAPARTGRKDLGTNGNLPTEELGCQDEHRSMGHTQRGRQENLFLSSFFF